MLLRNTLLACISSAIFASHTWAAGLEITQHGAKEMAHGFAGTATLLEDASVIAHNPAGLLRLQGQQFSAGLSLLHASIEYDARFISERVESLYGLPAREVPGPGKGTSKQISAIPHLYYSKRIDENSAFGIGLYVPFGSGTEFPAGWAGRYHAEETAQTAININPAFAFRLSDSWSVGMGFIAQIYQAKLTNQIDLGYLLTEAILERVVEQSGPEAAEAAAVRLLDNYGSNPNYQVYNDIELSSLAYGFNFGLLWDYSPTLRFGLNYRSAISHIAKGSAERKTLEQAGFKDDVILQVAGDANMSFADAAATLEKAFDERGSLGGDLMSQVHLPQILTLSAHWDASAKLAIMSNITWSDWSVFEEIRLEYTDKSTRGGSDITGSGDDVRRRDLVQPLNFKDSIRIGLGFRYQANDKLTLRTGFSFDQSPAQNDNFRTPRGPDANRTILGMGATYRFQPHMDIDLAYGNIAIEKAKVNARENPAGTQHRAEGHSQGKLNSISAQVSYRF